MKSLSKDLVQKERDKTLSFILIIFAIAGSIVVGLSLLRVKTFGGMEPALWAQVIMVFFAIIVALIRNKLPFWVKASFAISINIIIGFAGLFNFGLVDNSVMLLIAGSIIAAILGGSKAGLAVVGLNAIAVLVLIVLVQTSNWTFDVDANLYNYALSSWTVFLGAFIALTSITIYLIGKMSDILTSNMELLEKRSEQLEKSNKTKDQLFQLIAHDLRSPFQGLISGLELFSEEGEMFNEEQRQRLLRSMLRDSTSTFSMLENLLYWSRAQSGELKLDKKYIEVNTLVNSSLNPYLRIAEGKNIKVKVNIPIATLVYGDESSLKIVLSNLINNAIKFTDKGGEITIAAHTNNKTTHISIMDTGVGISEKNIAKLFDTQNSFSTRGTDNEKGTGLGLGVSYELVKRNGGDIIVKGNKEGGTTFTLVIAADISQVNAQGTA